MMEISKLKNFFYLFGIGIGIGMIALALLISIERSLHPDTRYIVVITSSGERFFLDALQKDYNGKCIIVDHKGVRKKVCVEFTIFENEK